VTRAVLCFGDSNTYGSIPGVAGGRYEWEIRWPGVLARELGDGWRVVEEGLPGRTTVFDDPLEPYRRGADYLPPCLASHTPLDAVVIFLGTNDLKTRLAAGPSDIAAGLGVLARTALVNAPHVLLLGLPRLGPRLPADFVGAAEKASELPRYTAEQAAEIGAGFLDLSDVAAYSEIDGFHLEPDGHAAIGNAVAQYLPGMF
jgi:lysophospholipase L1-like esterase